MSLYTYKAKCTRCVDGDTINLEIFLGFNVTVTERVRLLGIDTPETYGVKKGSEEYKAGMLAKEELERLILNKDILIVTEKDKKGKYGRYLAKIYTELDEDSPTFNDSCVNDILIKEGFAKVYK